MDAARGGGHSSAAAAFAAVAGGIAEEAARLWSELQLPVRVDWAAVAAQCASLWAHARALLLVPAVRLLVFLSLAMTVMILVEKLFVCAVCLVVRVLARPAPPVPLGAHHRRQRRRRRRGVRRRRSQVPRGAGADPHVQRARGEWPIDERE